MYELLILPPSLVDISLALHDLESGVLLPGKGIDGGSLLPP